MKIILLFSALILFTGGTFSQQYELDHSYITGTGFNGEVHAMEFDGNDKLLVGGNFTEYNGTAVNYLVRLNSDGTLDATYTPALTAVVDDLTIHSSNAVTVVTAGSLKRFLADGTTDATFVPVSLNGPIYCIDAEATGFKVVIGGWFDSVGSYYNILRLEGTGAIDATFTSNTKGVSNGPVRDVEISSTGKIVLGGDFVTFSFPITGGVTRNFICQLNSDGSLDTGFDPNLSTVDQINNKVYAVAVQADGKVLGGLTYYNARIGRCNTNGTKDFYGSTGKPGQIFDIHTEGTNDIIGAGSFEGGIGKWTYATGTYSSIVAGNGIEGATKEINTFAVQADGAIIIGGDFTSYNGIAASNFARIDPCNVSIDVQPLNAYICEGQDTSFTTTATGTGVLSYQWQVNTTSGAGLYSDITNTGVYSNATTNTLNITSATAGMYGYFYRCIVTDDICSKATTARVLTVLENQVITADPVDITVCENEQAAFSISFSGSSGGWQWQVDPGTNTFVDLVNGGYYSNVTSSTLFINNPPFSMNGYKYRLVSTNCNQSLVSAAATLNVIETPFINVQPSNQSICENGDAQFNITASVGSGSTTYQWQYRTGYNTYVDLTDGGIYSGTTTTTLVITGVDNTWPEVYESNNSDGIVSTNYRCVVTANGCSVNSLAPYLYIYEPPTVVTDPSNVTICNNGSGINTSFSVSTSYGTGIPTYQWQVDDGFGFVNLTPDAVHSNTTSSTLTLTGATAVLSGNLYRCEVGGCAPPVYSGNARLTIDDNPIIYRIPTTARICEGVDTSFSVGVTGVNLTYQWQLRTGATYTDLTDNSIYIGTNSSWMQIIGGPMNLDNNRYRCVITSENGACTVNTAEYDLLIETPPSMTQDYATRKICENQGTTFRVNTSNWNPTLYSYQWQVKPWGSSVYSDLVNGPEYSNVTGNTLTILVATPALDSAKYRCVIYGCTADIYSPDADLYVNILPVVTLDPLPQLGCAGGTATFTAGGTGTNVTYRWECDFGIGSWSSVTSANVANTSYTTSTLQIAQNGYKYRCVLRSENPCTQSVMTQEAQLNITGITEQPISNSFHPCYDDTVSFTVKAVNAISYQWLENNLPLSNGGFYSGVTTDSLIISGVNSTLSNKFYTCVVTGTCGDVSSTNANMNTVDGGPKPNILNVGGNDLSLNPQLYPDLNGSNCEWYLDGVLYYTDACSLIPTEAGSYTVIVIQNNCRSEESDPIVISNTVGIKVNIIADKFTIYPNPANDQLMINSENLKINSIKIIDVTGKIIKVITQNTTSIIVSDLPKGLYLLQVHTENGNGVKRFIKE